LARADNTEEEQTLKQGTINYCIRSSSYNSIRYSGRQKETCEKLVLTSYRALSNAVI